MKHSLDSIGVRLEVQKDKFPELLKLEKQCKLMMRSAAWIADYPDGDNFMQLLYGPNIDQSNNACYRSAEYDKLYEQTRALPDGPERDKLYREMTRIIEGIRVWIARRQPLPQRAGAAAGDGFKKHPDPARGMAVHRRRPEPTEVTRDRDTHRAREPLVDA